MPEDVTSGVSPLSPALISRHPLTRRRLLQTMAAISVATVGGAVLTACGGNPETKSDVTLNLGEWPISPLPGHITEEQAKESRKQATVDVLEAWQKKNPHIKFKPNATDISEVSKLQAAIAGGTAPAIYSTGSLKDVNGLRVGIDQGFVSEVTEIYQQKNVGNLMADYAKPLFENTYNFSGQYYCLPGDVVGIGWVIFMRRDLMEQYGIEDKAPTDWTWTYLQEVFQKFSQNNGGKPATAVPSWLDGFRFNSECLDPSYRGGGGILGAIPNAAAGDSNFHWKVTASEWLSRWEEASGQWRDMVNKDKTILQDPAFEWNASITQFAQEQMPVAFTIGLDVAFFPGSKAGPLPIRIKGDLSLYEKTITYIALPKGNNGGWDSSAEPSLGGVIFEPNLKKDALNAAAELYLYMFFEEGYNDVRHQAYTKDPEKALNNVYDYIAPTNKFQKNPHIKEGIEDVFGPRMVERYMSIIENRSPRPRIDTFLPKPDGQPGPTADAHNDLHDHLRGQDMAIKDALQKYQDTENQQISQLKSDLTWSEFKQGAEKYYKALDEYWKKYSPTFHQGDWKKYYNQHVLPELKK